jgi:hypothetical protein
MRLIMTTALALCLGTSAWADAPDKSKSAPANARLDALAPAASSVTHDPLSVQRQVLADFNRDIEARLRAHRLAAN